MCVHVIFWCLTLLDDVYKHMVCKTRLYVICIDLHVIYVFLYLYVMDIKIEYGFDIC
jgi:hypothetical protein